MGQAIGENADAIPLGLLAQQIANETTDPGVRAAAFDLWLRADPGRRAEAALALADARQAAAGADDPMAARGALQTAIEAAPGSALFWSVAAADARAGRQADAAATLAYGAEMWAPSALAPGLRACARSRLAFGEPQRAFEEMQATWPGGKAAEAPAPGRHPFELEARARLAERAGDAGALAPMLAAAAGGADPDRAASLAPRRAALVDRGGRRPGAGARPGRGAARTSPDDPAALPLLLLEDAVAPAAAGEALWRAGGRRGGRVGGADRAPVPAGRERERRADRGRSRRGRDARRSCWWRCRPTGSRSARCSGRPRVFRRISGRARWPSGPRSPARARPGPPSMRPTPAWR